MNVGIGQLQNFDGQITAQGKLLMQGTLLCTEERSNKKSNEQQLQVFLFDKCIIFASIVSKKKQFQYPLYDYKAHFQLNVYIYIHESIF